MIKRILVGLGGTPFGQAAVRHAAELARVHEAEVTGIAVVDIEGLHRTGPVPLGAGAAAHDLAEYRVRCTREAVDKVVAGFERECGEAEVHHAVRRETGNPLDALISHWRYHDLTVLGLRGFFAYGVLPEVPDAIVRLILEGVRTVVAAADTYRPVRRALIAYSGSAESAKAMKRFVQLRPWPVERVSIVCFERPDAERLLADAAAYCRRHGLAVDTASLPGLAREALLPYAASEGQDAIVLGDSARSLLSRRVFGDTALHVMRHSDRPLFISH